MSKAGSGLVSLSVANAERRCSCGATATAYDQSEGFVCGACLESAPEGRRESPELNIAPPAVSPQSPPEPAEPADAPASVGWDEGDLDYLADGALTVPGQGDRPEDCGDYLPLKYCPNCGEPHVLERTCGGRRCPSCHTVWMGEHAEKATVRMAAARESADEGIRRRVVHVVVSPPEGEIETTGGYQRGKKHAQLLAKRHGVRGGAVIGHGYRVKEDTVSRFRSLKDDGEIDGGLWRWILTERSGDWRTAVYFSPHYHIVGFAEDVQESSPGEDNGWIVSRIRSVERHHLHRSAPYEDLYGLFYYLLSHCSFDTDDSQHAVRWFGNVAYNQFSPEHLSDYKESVVRRMSRLARDEKLPSEYEHRCEEDDCETVLVPIMEAPDQLQVAEWCDSIGREQQRRLVAAVDWFYGRVIPPPGKQHPRSEAAAEEALAALLPEGAGEVDR